MRLLPIVVLLLLSACAPTKPAGSGLAHTQRVLTPAEVRATIGAHATLGDSSYAQVNSSSLRGFYEAFRADLFARGVTKWDQRFDCNHFASYFVSLAQVQFYRDNFHGRTQAQTLALGVYWYHQAGTGSHAIVVALTERGLIFIEPQTGVELSLTEPERESAFMVLL